MRSGLFVLLFTIALLVTVTGCSYMRNTPSYRAEESERNQPLGKTPSPSRKTPSLMEVSHSNSINSEADFYNSFSLRFGYRLNGDENPLLINEIAGWLGTPYRYGGDSKEGIDCSAFALNVYREVYGIDLDRMTINMSQRAQRINKQHLREGDLVFFRINQQRISHVGIYISNNKFAHASTRLGVIISDMNEEYYSRRFAFAGRIR
jgi:hypothetical protein